MKKIIAAVLICFSTLLASAQQPVIVQPGAPGQPTKTLPANMTAKLPPPSAKDVEFMQGMIMHHAQAVEMTALIAARTESKEIRKLGAKISQSQTDEINFMKRWLTFRGEKTELQMPNMSNLDGPMSDMPNMPNMSAMRHSTPSPHLMPGMLTPTQMEALKNAQGAEFDRLFLRGMIQHHQGALVMVKDLFATAGAGQDAELFNFATDIDTGQRGEIKIMQNLLDEKPQEEKR